MTAHTDLIKKMHSEHKFLCYQCGKWFPSPQDKIENHSCDRKAAKEFMAKYKAWLKSFDLPSCDSADKETQSTRSNKLWDLILK